jgi:hypothetical protein
LSRSAALAGVLAPVLTQPPPLDSRASTGLSGRVLETRVFRSRRFAHVGLGRRTTGSLIGRGVPQSLVDHDPRFRSSRSQRVTFEATRSGQLVQRRGASRRLLGTRARGARGRDRKACTATEWKHARGFAARARDVEARAARVPQPRAGASQPGSPSTTIRRSAAASRP